MQTKVGVVVSSVSRKDLALVTFGHHFAKGGHFFVY